MNTTWYVRQAGEVFGPASRDRIVEMLREGRLTRDAEVAAAPQGPFAPLHRVDGFETVRPIAEMAGPAAPAPSTPAPAVAAPAAKYLPDAVRTKYLKTLSEKGSAWVCFVGVVLAALVLPHVPGVDWLRAQSWGKWVVLVLFLMMVGGLVEAYKSWRMQRLLAHSDKMLEVLYNEYRPITVVMNILGWVVMLGVGAYLLSRFA